MLSYFMENKYIFIIIVFIILVLFLYTNYNEHLVNYTDDDYEQSLSNIVLAFYKYPEFSFLVNDKDFKDAIYNFKVIHDFNTSIILDIKNKQEILYCMIPPDQKNLCRGFRILNNQQFESDRLIQKLEYTKSIILKAIIGKLNIINNKYNDQNIIKTQDIFTKQLNYLIESIYKNLNVKT